MGTIYGLYIYYIILYIISSSFYGRNVVVSVSVSDDEGGCDVFFLSLLLLLL